MLKSKFWLAMLALGTAAWSGTAVAAVLPLKKVITDAPANVLKINENLNFKLNAKDVKGDLNYKIYDWQDNLVGSGTWLHANSQTDLMLSKLPKGFYRFEFYTDDGNLFEEIRFVVIGDVNQRERNLDSAYAIDTAQSWLARGTEEFDYELSTELCDRIGVSMIRDRMSWPDVLTPEKGKYYWGKYKTNADLMKKHKVPMLGMFHDTPASLKGKMHLPKDLFDVYFFCQALAKEFRGKAPAWEFWNEQNAGDFCHDPVWDYTAALKAGYLGFKSVDPNLEVVMGGLTEYPEFPLLYPDLTLANGGGDYMDVFNFHLYSNLAHYQPLFEEMRKLTARYGIDDKPVWITESGMKFEGEGRLEPMYSNCRELDETQDRMVTEGLMKNSVLVQQLGSARNFLFVLMPYNEYGGKKPWGMLRWDHMPKMTIPAYAAQIELLEWAKPLGEVKLGENLRGFVFRQSDGLQTLVFWSTLNAVDTVEKALTRSEVDELYSKDSEVKFTLPEVTTAKSKLYDMMGKELSMDLDYKGRLSADRYVRYITNLDGLNVDIPAVVPAAPKASDENLDKSIVLRMLLPERELQAKGSMLPAREIIVLKNGDELTFEIYNFSKFHKSGYLKNNTGVKLQGLDKAVTVAPFSKSVIKLTYAGNDDRLAYDRIHLTGEFGDKVISPFVAPVYLGDYLAENYKAIKVDLSDAKRWKNPDPGKFKMHFNPDSGLLSCEFTVDSKDDVASFPVFDLLGSEFIDGAVGCEMDIRAESKLSTDKFEWFILGTVYDNQEVNNFVFPLPAAQWEKLYLTFNNKPYFTPEKVRQLRLGMKPKDKMADKVILQVKNLVIYKEKNK